MSINGDSGAMLAGRRSLSKWSWLYYLFFSLVILVCGLVIVQGKPEDIDGVLISMPPVMVRSKEGGSIERLTKLSFEHVKSGDVILQLDSSGAQKTIRRLQERLSALKQRSEDAEKIAKYLKQVGGDPDYEVAGGVQTRPRSENERINEITARLALLSLEVASTKRLYNAEIVMKNQGLSTLSIISRLYDDMSRSILARDEYLISQLVEIEREKDALNNDVREIETDLAEYTASLLNTTICSPVAGTLVLDHGLHEQTYIPPGFIVGSIKPDNQARAELDVPINRSYNFTRGTVVTLELEAQKGKKVQIEGTVADIDAQVVAIRGKSVRKMLVEIPGRMNPELSTESLAMLLPGLPVVLRGTGEDRR